MRTKIIVSVLVVNANHRILFVRYPASSRDQQAGWFLPNTILEPFGDPGECAEAVARERLPEAALSIKFSHFESFEGRDGSWHFVTHFVARCEARTLETIQDAEWFDSNSLPPDEEVAHHGWANQIVRSCREQGRLT